MVTRKAIWATSPHWLAPLRVSAHHYARLLAEQDWDVAFLSCPVSPIHLAWALSHETRIRFRSWLQGGESDLHGRLLCYSPFTFLPPANAPVLRSRGVLRMWHRATVPGVLPFLRARGFGRIDLLVLDSVRYHFLLDEIDHRRSVMRITDNIAGFDWATPAFLEMEERLIRAVDCVCYTATAMEERIARLAPKAMVHLPNGVDVSHFIRSGDAIPTEYEGIPRPRAVYVGAIAPWFDVELVARCARRLPDTSFVLIGPVTTDLGLLRSCPNVFILGRRSYASVPAYMRHADVGLIPFRVNNLVHSVNPVKLWEYFACGLPVVAARWTEMESLATPAVLCDNADEFVAAVQKSATVPVDRATLAALAREADWAARFEVLAEVAGLGLGNRPPPSPTVSERSGIR